MADDLSTSPSSAERLGYRPLNRTWAKVEIFLGLLAVGAGLLVGNWAIARGTNADWVQAGVSLLLFVLGAYLALAGHRSHLYQSSNELFAQLSAKLEPPPEPEPEPVVPGPEPSVRYAVGNLFTSLPSPGPDESVVPLWVRQGLTVERIVSRGHRSPPDEWYDQPTDEWVVLLEGAAVLVLEGEPAREVRPGDWILLRAHVRHRVEWTDPERDTVWLAVHARGAAG